MKAKSWRNVFVIAGLAACALICFRVILSAKKAEDERKRSEFEELCGEFGPAMEEELQEALTEWTSLYHTVDVSASCGLTDRTLGGRRLFEIRDEVTVHIDGAFDEMTDDDQNRMLENLKWYEEEARTRVFRDRLTELNEYLTWQKLPFYDCEIYQDAILAYTIRTEGNTYEYVNELYCFRKNGSLHYTQFSDKYEAREEKKREKKYGISGRIYDPGEPDDGDYNVDEFDDPEDFWLENRDEFGDYDEAADYWAEYWE